MKILGNYQKQQIYENWNFVEQITLVLFLEYLNELLWSKITPTILEIYILWKQNFLLVWCVNQLQEFASAWNASLLHCPRFLHLDFACINAPEKIVCSWKTKTDKKLHMEGQVYQTYGYVHMSKESQLFFKKSSY